MIIKNINNGVAQKQKSSVVVRGGIVIPHNVVEICLLSKLLMLEVNGCSHMPWDLDNINANESLIKTLLKEV